MLRLHRERPEIAVAAACWRVITAEVQEPVLHWCDAGAASWFDVAVAVGELAQELGLLQQPAAVIPITTADYLTPAPRPSYSLLDWRRAKRWTCLLCTGGRRFVSCWRPWHELNRGKAWPPLGC